MKFPIKPSSGFVVDGHAHIYPAFDLCRWLEVGVAAAHHHGCPLVLFLTESTGCHYFAALRDRALDTPGARPSASLPGISDDLLRGFRVTLTTEDCSLAVSETTASEPLLFIVAGRQYVSRDELEVLALGLSPASQLTHLEEGSEPAQMLIERLLEEDIVVVLPWGFGKWTGRRRREVTRLAGSPILRSHPLFFVGDIAARCWPWRSPASFVTGARVIAGSDILPLPGAESGLACYGFRLSGALDTARPLATVRASLKRNDPVEIVGKRQGLVVALWQQIRYRLRDKAPR
jgi:hypothetical protein